MEEMQSFIIKGGKLLYEFGKTGRLWYSENCNEEIGCLSGKCYAEGNILKYGGCSVRDDFIQKEIWDKKMADAICLDSLADLLTEYYKRNKPDPEENENTIENN